MKAQHIVLYSILLLMASQVQGASLSVGDNLKIESINGQRVNAQEVELKEGIHMVALKFSDFYVINAEDSGWVRSEPLFTRVQIEQGEAVMLQTHPLHSEEEAQEFLEDPVVNLVSNKRADGRQMLMNQSQIVTHLLQGK
ncbi:DUF2057 family protein [Shewanella corallii]|uniref:DUF2057 family protein n=1 Tax=Shewanella corallii TaxID=560080 RepID=A0ABT0N9R6_9GAMM|nr:DUF2057 family protein [Shewanella corallii]MCL2915204.1 DUF2057 family protein [Shewanella corallii]